VGDDLDLAVVEVGDGDALAEVAGKTVNLDAGLEEGGEGRRVEDLVVGGLGSVDDELLGDLLVLLSTLGGGGLLH
jgi:hypothetical protein